MKKTEQKKYINQIRKIQKILTGDQEAVDACKLLEGKIISVETTDEKIEAGSYPVPSEISNGGIAAFSDGACRGNPGPGSWGYIVQESSGEIIQELSDIDSHTTNNKMELSGAIRALEYLLASDKEDEEIYLFTDSTYVVKGITEWVKGWKARGWRKADKKAPENLELWQKLDEITASFSNLHYRWVKGHSGHPQNERCDQLANIALDEAGY